MVATVIAAETGNGVGVSGICSRCAIMPVRVLSHRDGGPAEGSTADVAAGIVWAAEHHAQVINLSLSTATPSRLLEAAVRRTSSEGSLVVAAAGNGGSTAREYPAAIEPSLAVGTVRLGATSPASNRNPLGDKRIDVAAEDNISAMDRQVRRRFHPRGT